MAPESSPTQLTGMPAKASFEVIRSTKAHVMVANCRAKNAEKIVIEVERRVSRVE